MKQPVNCPHFFADYQRGRDLEKCRLIAKNRANRRRWRRALCETCPVPDILRNTTCNHLALEASVVRRWGIWQRVAVYTICTNSLQELHDPKRCAACEQDKERLQAG